MLTGTQLEEICKLHFRETLPYLECRRLAAGEQLSEDDLTTALQMYLSTIAALAGSGSRLYQQPVTVLRRAKETLALDFFESYPSLKRYNSMITKHHTPKLYEQMVVAEQLRRGLLDLISSFNLR